MTVDTEKYLDFVHDVTSAESLDYAALLTRMNKLELEDDCNLSQLLTAALGPVSYTHLTLPTILLV